uniref:Protein kinase domain-containing protein n=2 Tax=Paramoeba aestuarina TaxID=180227 RepID=A0A7S4L6L4_9EUKA|mmetsp:Transcript_32364/g.50633  ORF Transcript_32364/g.50633 Transcript_32364/m.50633 type:complete len:378 (+) Transcript_32364:21-1154(+)
MQTLLREIEELKKKVANPWHIDAKNVSLTKKLGSGACGEVWKGSYMGQDVAVKILNAKVTNQITKDFDAELALMREFRSPYTVTFFGVCERPHPCLVMEFCDRGCLYTVLNKHRDLAPLDWSYFLSHAHQIAKGLQALHGWVPSIVHRDMKSQNILVTQNYQLKIADFGTARFAVQDKERECRGTSPTQGKKKGYRRYDTFTQVRGTYSYMSPEIRFRQPVTVKSDIYAVGIILWEMVYRCINGVYEDPYAEFPALRTIGEALYKAVAEKGTRPTIPSSCPPAVAALIRRCWHSEPKMRPTAVQLIASVESLQKEYNSHEEEWEDAILYHDSDDPDYDSDDSDDDDSDESSEEGSEEEEESEEESEVESEEDYEDED